MEFLKVMLHLVLGFLGIHSNTASANEVAPPLPSSSIARDPNTILILFGTRHGCRNPENYVNPSDKSWGQEGPLELNRIGKKQALGLGKEIRKFIGNDYINANYFGKEAVFYASSAPRCQMTLQTAIAGLYTPLGFADWDKRYDNWSPVPYTIDDQLLRMYNVKNCPKSDEAWAPISNDSLPSLAKMESENIELLKYMAENTGWQPKVSLAADLADNIIMIEHTRAKYPQWMNKPTLAGYDKKKLIAAYSEFAEAHYKACAEHMPCRQMMGGYWLKHTIDSMKTAATGKGPKVIGYASHTEVTLAVMKLMGYTRKELTTSAGFVLEFKNTPQAMVRLLEHDPNPVDKHVIYQGTLIPELSSLQDSNGFIPLADFEKVIGQFEISDWETACGRTNNCQKA
ncbi:unnamed protein product, partial [Mesorhabditis belari]|uniref:Uncharacterized protein n=1 Tax=Mesorhabditis belari TaxID=2138241 RepID=A0AAF3J526_9BILA